MEPLGVLGVVKNCFGRLQMSVSFPGTLYLLLDRAADLAAPAAFAAAIQ